MILLHKSWSAPENGVAYRDVIKNAYEVIGSPAGVSLHNTLEHALQTYPSAAAMVATQTSTHLDFVLIVINAGRDVLVEKPFCSHAF